MECGDASSLNTTDKTSLVSAINEVNTNEINNTYYKTGDSITLPFYIINGFITNSTKDVTLALILPKSLENITT
mgnify:CR=1 FL=1